MSERAESLSPTTSLLTDRHHPQITKHLDRLSNQELIEVGLRLGLRYPRLKKMNTHSILNDMVHAWLRKDDDVLEARGEPSWESLSSALEECGNKGIAVEVKKQCKGCKSDGENSESLQDGQAKFKHRRNNRRSSSSARLSLTINEKKEMDEHKSYHQTIIGREAKKRLKKCGDHCYLTRYSMKRECYVLTVLKKTPMYVIRHFKIDVVHHEALNYKLTERRSSSSMSEICLTFMKRTE